MVDSNAEGATAGLLKIIGISLDAWRQEFLRDLIKTSNNDVQIISIFLARTANAIQKGDKFANSVTDKYFGGDWGALRARRRSGVSAQSGATG